MRIALVGTTGYVAGRALERLVAAGADVVVLVREPSKLPEHLRANIDVQSGTLEDRDFVIRATRGADVLLWLTPATLAAEDLRTHTLALAANAVHAIRANDIARVVFVSGHGADRADAGQVSFSGEVERMLEAAPAHTVVLRSAGLMENLFGSLPALKGGQLFGVLLADKKYPLVAARDVGDVAARWLLDPAWTGHHVRGVHGAADLSTSEQAQILSQVLDTPIRYQQIPLETLRDVMTKRGASASVAAGYVDMFRTYAAPDYRPTEPRTPETTTPTKLETFVREQVLPRLR